MSLLRGATPLAGMHLGNTPLTGVYRGAERIWSRGVTFTDELDSLSAFTVTQTGGGLVVSSGQVQWNGSTNGYGNALFNGGSPASTDRYAAITPGTGLTSNTRYSGVILCTDADRTQGYGLSFRRTSVHFKDFQGNWFEGPSTDLASATVDIGTDTLVEVWNIGTLGYAAVNGVTVINGVQLSAAKLSASYDKQGFGLYRDAFASSTSIASWRGGDASEWGKT